MSSFLDGVKKLILGEMVEEDQDESPPSRTHAKAATKVPPPSTTSQSDRRRTPRVAIRVPAHVCWAGGQASGTSNNISLGGCRIVVNAPVAAGTPLIVQLALPHCPAVALEGHVVRSHSHGLSVALTVESQDRFVPYWFASRHGEVVTSWLTRADVPANMASKVYVVGCPSRFSNSQLVSLVAPCGTVETATLTRLQEGTIGTVTMDSLSAARTVYDMYHRQLVGGAALFVYLPGTRTAEILRLVLQYTALERFTKTQRLA